MDDQLPRNHVAHRFQRPANGFLAAQVSLAHDLPADVVAEEFEDALNIGVGEGDVQVAQECLLRRVAAIGV